MSVLSQYRKPRLVKAIAGWYIIYYYRVPKAIRHIYPIEWYRFRITEDMNRRRGEDKAEYAAWLLKSISNSLKAEYNPFETALDIVTENKGIIENEAISAKEDFASLCVL